MCICIYINRDEMVATTYFAGSHSRFAPVGKFIKSAVLCLPAAKTNCFFGTQHGFRQQFKG